MAQLVPITLILAQKQGKGKLVFPNHESYEGDFMGNKFHGEGVWRGANGQDTYSGGWFRNKKDGPGVLTSTVNGAIPLNRTVTALSTPMRTLQVLTTGSGRKIRNTAMASGAQMMARHMSGSGNSI